MHRQRRVATLRCDAEEGAVRLANGAAADGGGAEYGRLEVFHDGGWGTVCDNAAIEEAGRRPAFNAASATVACRQLGYQEGFQLQNLVRPWH